MGKLSVSKTGLEGSNPSSPAISDWEKDLVEWWEKYTYTPETVEELFHPPSLEEIARKKKRLK